VHGDGAADGGRFRGGATGMILVLGADGEVAAMDFLGQQFKKVKPKP
jgi:hypothetical protein